MKQELIELIKQDIKVCEEMSEKVFQENQRAAYWDGKANGLRTALHFIELYCKEKEDFMFWIGLGIGLFIGAFLGVLIIGICIVGKKEILCDTTTKNEN